MESLHDVLVVGGGPAGLSAALLLGLARRRVLVIDRGQPRNAPAPVSHGFFTRDGALPGDILAIGREQLQAYPNVQFLSDTVVDGRSETTHIVLQTAAGQQLAGRKVIIAQGAIDQLPSIPGLAECWGKSIFPCPYCHAWEYRDQPIAVLSNGPGIARNLALLRCWSPNVALCTNGPLQADLHERNLLYRAKAPVYDRVIVGFEHEDGQLKRIVFDDTKVLTRAAALYHPPQRSASDLPTKLGLVQDGTLRINPQTAQTVNPNIYVAGDMVSMFPPQILPAAVYSGSFSGRQVTLALAMEDFS